MINTSDPNQKHKVQPLHPASQFLIFAAIIIGTLIIGTCLGVAIAIACYGLKIITSVSQLDVNAPHFLAAMWIIQLFGMTIPIFLAPLIFSWAIVNNSIEYLKLNVKFSWVTLILVFGIMLAALPLVEFLSNVNRLIPPPHFLAKWVEDSENNAEKVTNAFLQMNTIWLMLFNLIFIGLLTAIAEEFMFRGVLQSIFEKWMKNKHVAVWVTAIIFSAFHQEYFGFLPRVILGGILGYFVMYSGSIWPAVLGHFINNATDIILNYFSQHKIINIKSDDQHIFNWPIYVVSLIIILFLFYVYHQAAIKKPEQVNGEELG